MFFRLEHIDEIVKTEGKGRMDRASLRKHILENQLQEMGMPDNSFKNKTKQIAHTTTSVI